MDRLEAIHNAPLAIGIFHSYGHERSCQAQFHPYVVEGLGLTDGEACERLWSYLGGHATTTRYMTPFNRTMLLTMALDHFKEKRTLSIGKLYSHTYMTI